MKILTTALFFISLTILTACGGGGNNAPSSTATKIDQTPLAFASAQQSFRLGQEVIYSLSGGSGSGAVIYSSSNTNVATIDSSGKVSIIGVGSTTITVQKSGDATYKDASASFTLIITKKLQDSFVFPQASLEHRLGDQMLSLTATGGSGSGSISYSLENATLATIDTSTGVITPLKAGTTRVFATKATDEMFEKADAEYSLIIKKQLQTPLVFQLNHVEKLIDAGSFLNELTGGSGTGELIYSTNNSTVATINEKTGEVSVLNSGNVNISVTKKEDENFEEATTAFTLSVIKKTQSKLEFSTNYLETYLGSNVYENHLTGGSGNGLVTFISGDENIATVDKFTGQLTLINEGQTTISAIKAEDSNYQATTTTYTLDVGVIVDELIADVGLNETLISWKKQQGAISYFRTRSLPCEHNTINTCDEGTELSIPTQEALPIKDNTINIFAPGYISVGNNKHISTFQLLNKKSPAFSKRSDPELISFKNKFFIIGGITYGDQYICNNEIWSSIDGVTWVQEKKKAAFSARNSHQIIEFNNSLWLYGGEECIGTDGASWGPADLWHSDDGINWTQVQVDVALGSRIDHSFIVFKEKMWLYGGQYGNSEIWSSADGTAWEKAAINAPFQSRSGQQMVVFDNKMWLIGGLIFEQDGFNVKNDIWSSSDGINWVKEKENAHFSSRQKHQIVEFKGALYLIGGNANDFGSMNEVWRSTNAIDWTLINSPVIDNPLSASQVVVFNNQLWLLEYSGAFLWRSYDANNWYVPMKVPTEWQAR